MLFRRKEKETDFLDLKNIPQHVAVIMDGNGRWAQKRGLPRNAGHSAGSETFRRAADYMAAVGVKYFTVYAFSTENWKRPPEEVNAIMGLLEKYLGEAIDSMRDKNIHLCFWGDLTPLSPGLKMLIERTNAISRQTNGLWVNVCLNYGGRAEIVAAVRQLMRSGADQEAVDEAAISNSLYSAGIPDPDLIIRPGGEKRTSNFLLWQTAYSEYYFTDTLWPDMNEKALEAALVAYQRRKRRFGGLGDKQTC